MSGTVTAADDPGYDEARRVWNGMVDRRPALIAHCDGTADVIAALDVARAGGLEIAVRSGGHSVAGRSTNDDGLVIDLGALDDVHVDRERRTARVGPGARWARFDHETQAFGLATTGGVHSGTGVGGLALGGGMGYLARRCGLTVDNIVGAEVVLADGRVVSVGPERETDLYWAIRGGAAHVGVVTEIELGLHTLGPEVMTAQAYFDVDAIADGLAAYRDLAVAAPDELSVYALVIKVPPIAEFPAERHGAVALAVVACWSGEFDDGADAVAPVAAMPGAFVAFAAPMPYTALQSAFDDGSPNGARYYWKSHFVPALSDAAIGTLAGIARDMPGDMSMMFLEPFGGAINRVDPESTVFPHRSYDFNFGIQAGWTDRGDDAALTQWARDVHAELSPHGAAATYANYLDHDDVRSLHAAYGRNAERLRGIAKRHDPDGTFGLR